MPPFIPGLELSRRFYFEVVRPILDTHYPGLPYAAAYIGPGSDVLGFDTEMSTDHDWGPAVQLFLGDGDAHRADAMRALLARQLPPMFCGYPVGIQPDASTGSPDPRRHRVVPVTLRAFVRYHLAYDIDRPPDAADWLTFASQKLRELTAGAVHEDQVGELTALRARLAYYPHPIWLYLLAAGWARIGQEEHLMPRAGYVGDELGSALMGSRLVRDVMQLCFLMEKQYAPYPKWFGTAFRQLNCAAGLAPSLWRGQTAHTWQEREAALNEAYETLARLHNGLGITTPLPEKVAGFFDRPFKVINADAFAEAICAQITDPDVRRIASRRLIGGIDQWSDSTDIRSHSVWRPILRNLYL